LLFCEATPAAASTCPDEDVPSVQLSIDEFDQSVFCLINVERADNDVRQLRPNALLDIAAADYTKSLMAGRFFSHAGDFAGHDNVSDPIQRLREIGYVRRGRPWMVGEDLRWSTPETSMPADIVEAWMNSPVHRFWLLRARFRELGVAATPGTPIDPDLPDGITVAAEFGFRQ
jgi:uncharacterized protein YkwD